MPTMAEVLEGRAHQAEMRAHTPTPGENARLAVTNLLSPILGAPAAERVGSVVENVLDFGPVPAKMATELVQQPVRAGEAVGEALADPSLPNVANAGLQTALTFGPSATLGAAGRALGAIPKSVTMSGALLGLPFATASEAGEGSENPLYGLLTDRASKVRQRDEALAEAKRQERTGRGPRWEAAMSEVNKLENELAALDSMIADMQRRNSPEYQMELEQKRKEMEETEQARRAQTPTRELYSDLVPYIPVATGAIGLGMGALLKGRGTKVYNDTLKALNERWQNAVKAGHDAMAKGNRVKAQRFADEATALKAEFEAAKAAGPRGTGSATAIGAGAGVTGAFLPEEIDLARAPAGSDLQKKTYEALFSDPLATAERAGIGAFLGAAPAFKGAELAGALMRRSTPTGFAPETVSLSNMLKRTARPQRPRSQGPQATPQAQRQGGPMSTPQQTATAGTKAATSSSQPVQTPFGLRDPATGRWTKKP